MNKNNKIVPARLNGVKRKFLSTFILLITFPLIAFAADPPGIPEGWSEGYAYANEIRIHYYRAVPAPDKPVIVMVHGITDNGLCWTTLGLELQEDYDIYMLDARGHGLSDSFTASDDEETLMKDVAGFIETMGLEKPILMGHSMGAATVMRLGAAYPDLAQAIVMLDPFISRPRPNNIKPESARSRKDQAGETSKKESDKISINMHGTPETLVKQNNYSFEELVRLGQRQFPKWDKVDIQYWALSKKQYHGAYTPDAWEVMSGNMRTGDALEKIKVPSLILKADTSSKEREGNMKAVKNLKKIKLLHLENTGHNLHHDDLHQTVAEISDFLAKL